MTRLPACAALLGALLGALLAGPAAPVAEGAAPPGGWKNPVYRTAAESVAAAVAAAGDSQGLPDPDRDLFVRFNLADGDRPGTVPMGVVRRVQDDVIVTWGRRLERHPVAAPALRQVLDRLERERRRVARRADRLGIPAFRGLLYCRLLADLDDVADIMKGPQDADDPGARLAGFTTNCRYVIVPVSTVSPGDLARLEARAVLDARIDVPATLASWREESLRRVTGTLRHEIAHVHVNSALGAELYADRTHAPLWFHEGVATWLSGETEATLSRDYRHYLGVFVYLAERHGLRRLTRFVERVVRDHQPATAAIRAEYGARSYDDLSRAADRWHSWRYNIAVAFTLAFLVLLIQAFRGCRIPFLALASVLAGLFCLYHVAAGTVAGARGVDGVLAVRFLEAALSVAGLWLLVGGVLRLRRQALARRAMIKNGEEAPDATHPH